MDCEVITQLLRVKYYVESECRRHSIKSENFINTTSHAQNLIAFVVSRFLARFDKHSYYSLHSLSPVEQQIVLWVAEVACDYPYLLEDIPGLSMYWRPLFLSLNKT